VVGASSNTALPHTPPRACGIRRGASRQSRFIAEVVFSRFAPFDKAPVDITFRFLGRLYGEYLRVPYSSAVVSVSYPSPLRIFSVSDAILVLSVRLVRYAYRYIYTIVPLGGAEDAFPGE
jgi:hypothetical protein